MNKTHNEIIDNRKILEWGNYVDLFQADKNSPAIINKHGYQIKDRAGYSNYLQELYQIIDGNDLQISLQKLQIIVADAYFTLKEKPDLIINLRDEIEKIPMETVHFLLPLFNAHIEEIKLTVWNYTFVKYQFIAEYVKEIEYPPMGGISNKDFCDSPIFEDTPFVDISVNARDREYAQDFAKDEFRAFVSFLRVAVYYNSRGIAEPISDRNTYINRESFIVSQNRITKYFSPNPLGNKYYDISIASKYFDEMNNESKHLFEILKKANESRTNKESRTEIEKRIYNAIIWLGMALEEKNDSVAFIQAMFSIECLLQQQEEPFSKSTVALISEEIAFLLGNSRDERKQFEKQFKDFYKTRSKIVHGKATDLSNVQVFEIVELSKRIIKALLVMNVDSLKSLSEVISDLRYS